VKRIRVFLPLCLLLCGCAAYKFQKGESPYDKGYVVSREGYSIPEYTLGENNSVPGLKTARERFKRRKSTIEDYYKKMGYIENRFKQNFYDPSIMFVQFVGGVFRLPFIIISEYRYAHDPKYRARIDKRDEDEYNAERARKAKLKTELNDYVRKDLTKEGAPVQEQKTMPEAAETLPPVSEVAPVADTGKSEEAKPVVKEEPAAPEKEPVVQEVAGALTAVITAKPQQGPSPLAVHFYADKSRSKKGRIVSYYWEFGDRDHSINKNPVNTYYSTTFGSKYFTATLTVKDDKGNTATASTVIEVKNR